MNRNVGTNERYVRLALGVVAAMAAARSRGWKRSVLWSLAASGLSTGVSQYCPVNQLAGIDRYHARTGSGVPGDVTRDRSTEIKEQLAVNAALGRPPSYGSDQPPVTREGDMFGREAPAL